MYIFSLVKYYVEILAVIFVKKYQYFKALLRNTISRNIYSFCFHYPNKTLLNNGIIAVKILKFNVFSQFRCSCIILCALFELGVPCDSFQEINRILKMQELLRVSCSRSQALRFVSTFV